MAAATAEAAALDALKRGGPGAAEALFEAHTAAELRAVERQLRAGIEGKREELRQMVGERYRDLIEAADTIAEMRLSAEHLLEAVRGLQQRRARGRPSAQHIRRGTGMPAREAGAPQVVDPGGVAGLGGRRPRGVGPRREGGYSLSRQQPRDQ